MNNILINSRWYIYEKLAPISHSSARRKWTLQINNVGINKGYMPRIDNPEIQIRHSS